MTSKGKNGENNMAEKEWLKSVYSDTTENFVSNPYPKKGETVTFTLRMLKNDDVKHVFLRAREYGVEGLHEMKACGEDSGLAYFEVSLTVRDHRFNYHFYLVTDECIYYYSQYQIRDYIPSEEHDFVLLADYDAPKWVKNAVFYQIFPDRFCNGRPALNVKPGEYSYQGFTPTEEDWDSPAKEFPQGHNLDFHNGDLYGIIEKLDYLKDLGITAIYLNPIFLSPSTHKYDALDYFHIDPHLGGDEAFAKLISEVHKRGMKLLLDISINHTSSSAKWFNKGAEFYPESEGAYNDKNSPYRDFYFFNDDNSYTAWFGVQTMPQLNYTSQKLRDIIYRAKDSVLKKWMLPPYGIDGWRFDVADCMARNEKVDVHEEVLSEIRKELKSVNKEVYLLAEEWADCASDLKGDRWDATMNYFGTGRALREFAGAKDLYHERNDILRDLNIPLTARQLASRITQFLSVVPGAIQLQQFNLLDSHDVLRLHTNKDVSEKALKAALLLQFTLPGTPSIYYGDEILLDGLYKLGEDYGCRYPFDWNWEKNPKSVESRKFYQKLISLRRTEKALSEGSFSIVAAEGFVIATARFTRDQVIFTVASRDSEERLITLPLMNFGIQVHHVSKDFFGSLVQSFVNEKENSLDITVSPGESYIIKFSK